MATQDGRNAPVDCVIIGYNDTDFEEYARIVRMTKGQSGAHHTVVSNSVVYRGQRMPYMGLLNRVLQDNSGVDPALHVCKLPNLGVSYLKNYLLRSGLTAEIVNFFNDEKEKLKALLRDGALCVAITTTFYTTSAPIVEIVRFIRKVRADTVIVVGGPFVFNTCARSERDAADTTLSRIGADLYVNDSQGEGTLAQIVARVKSGARSFVGIPNLILPSPGGDGSDDSGALNGGSRRMARSLRVPEQNPMDEFSVDWRNFPEAHFTPTVQMRTARSCAYRCAFCCYPAMAGKLNLTSISVIERELRYLASCGTKNIVFIDDTFNIPRARFKSLCSMMIANDFRFSWFSYFRAGNADMESIELAVRSGCKGVFLGVESGDQRMLDRMNKAANVRNYVRAIHEMNKMGVFTFASMIVGFPGETRESVDNSIGFLQEAAPSGYRVELYYHSRNTPVHKDAAKYRIEGVGYAWTHATMTWSEAVGHIHRIYKTVDASVIIAEYMFDFWSLPYLIGKGMSAAEYTTFLRNAQPLLIASMEGCEDSCGEAEEKLRGEMRGLSFAQKG